MPNRRPDPARERMLRKRLVCWKASGLKISAFCEREGVTPTALAHWRKEIAARDARAANAAAPSSSTSTSHRPARPRRSKSPSPTAELSGCRPGSIRATCGPSLPRWRGRHADLAGRGQGVRVHPCD